MLLYSMKELTWQFRLKDKTEHKDFIHFVNTGHNFPIVILVVSVVFAVWILPSAILTLLKVNGRNDVILAAFSTVLSLIVAFLGVTVCYFHHYQVKNDEVYSNTNITDLKWPLLLKSCFILSLTAYNVVFLLQVLFSDSGYYFPSMVLHDEETLYSILALFCMSPAVMMIALHEAHIDYVLYSLLSTDVVFIIHSIIHNGSSAYTIPMLTVWTTIAIIIIFDVHFSRITKFLQQKRLKEALLEIERMQAEELRHMIGNVAHDLKTPVASFIAGIDIIEDAVLELEDHMIHKSTVHGSDLFCITTDRQRHDQSIDLEKEEATSKQHEIFADISTIRNNITNIKRSLENARTTNSFMLMTINRCIDYTKASKGMKLTPKYETVNVMETIMLPLRCMSNIQEKIRIVLEPLSADICSHIITDKQWLQENLLCLLSNAVKYSSSGDVTITVTLVRDFIATEGFIDGFVHRLFQPPKDQFFQPKKFLKHFKTSASRIFPTHPYQISTEEEASSNNNLEQTFSNIKTSMDGDLHRTMPDDKKRLMTFSNGDLIYESLEEIDEADIYLHFEIDDHGVGLSDEAMKGLFNPFKQAQRLAGGTGLGLYSLAKRMDAIKGQYGVTKRRDGEKGSTFWFSIPYKPDNILTELALMTHSVELSQKVIPDRVPLCREVAQVFEPVIHHQHHTPDTTNDTLLTSSISRIQSSTACIISPRSQIGSPYHWDILLVDDSPTIVKMMVLMMKRHGHCITTAENGEIALQLIEERWKRGEGEFDFVLMDLQMPVMDGLEATRRLRKIELEREKEREKVKLKVTTVTEEGQHGNTAVVSSQSTKLIVIGMSANSDDETVEEAMRAGLTTFIAKPFSLEKLMKVVTNITHP